MLSLETVNQKKKTSKEASKRIGKTQRCVNATFAAGTVGSRGAVGR